MTVCSNHKSALGVMCIAVLSAFTGCTLYYPVDDRDDIRKLAASTIETSPKRVTVEIRSKSVILDGQPVHAKSPEVRRYELRAEKELIETRRFNIAAEGEKPDLIVNLRVRQSVNRASTYWIHWLTLGIFPGFTTTECEASYEITSPEGEWITEYTAGSKLNEIRTWAFVFWWPSIFGLGPGVYDETMLAPYTRLSRKLGEEAAHLGAAEKKQ
ncbi:MAG TPA: hypothetical protein PL033_01050 [Candidatus Brocadiia bacterium]|nr:hypothetical protein [Candidatus Brocadiia bacterium]